MYVVTFYSFKGGVGRSLALVNVACELAARGRTVLLVDSDLEAPGLETFPVLECATPKPGLVDFIHRYMATGETPSVNEYVTECTAKFSSGGKIWLMTAGQAAERYGQLFTTIDWQLLYERHDGFLMFEDLKLQWASEFNPDYVLIDSRTGHTDVGGICTRQLPDSVFMFFFPNEQNVKGLEKVVSDIRQEERRIEVNFVLSNVPDLDDEHDILKSQVQRAQRRLGYEELTGTIHHYDSMALLDQEAFVVSRPKTKLAAEYRTLAKSVMRGNVDDRDGVREYIETLRNQTMREIFEDDRAKGDLARKTLEVIAEKYEDDESILTNLALIYDLRHDYGTCLALLRRVHSLVGAKPNILFNIARLVRLTEGAHASVPHIVELFRCPKAPVEYLKQGVQWVRYIEPESLESLLSSDAVGALKIEDQCALLEEMLWPGCEPWAERLFQVLIESESLVGEVARNGLVLAAIALRRFTLALRLIGDVDGDDISGLFNRAIADWGEAGSPNRSSFRQVISCHEGASARKWNGPNYWMCIGISYLVVGSADRCRDALTAARGRMKAREKPEFSSWRFREVSPADFLSDLDSIEKSLTGGQRPPVVASTP